MNEKELTGGKYNWLLQNDISTTDWTELNPNAPHYLFIPQNEQLEDEYNQYKKITEIFPINGWGIATRKDYLLVDFSKDQITKRFTDIANLETQEAIRKFGIKQSPHWDFAKAKKNINKDVAKSIKPILFRPFDVRYIYYEKFMIERGDHRFELMSNMFQPNLSFITVRRSETAHLPAHFFCSKEISVLHSTSAKEGNFIFPALSLFNRKARFIR